MDGLPASALVPGRFSRWLVWGVLAALVVIAVDAAIVSASALDASLAAVALVVALAGRLGDTVAVAAVALVGGVGSGVWNGFDVAWGYALATLVACMGLALVVALLRANALMTAHRLALLRALLGPVGGPPEASGLVDRLLHLLVPGFADGAAIYFGEQRLGARGDVGDGERLELPLQARGATFGRLVLALGPSRRRYSAADRAFADLVADRVAVVLDNAGLTRQAAEAERRLVAALDVLGEAVTMNDPDGRTVYVNQAAVELLKAGSAAELTSAAVGEISARFAVLDEQGRAVAIEDYPAFKALRGEDRPAPLLVRNIVRATGEERWLNNKVTVLRGAGGGVDRVVNVIEDVTDVKRAELNQRLVVEVTQVLSSSPDDASMLQRVAEIAVAGLADWCAIDLPGPGGALQRVGLARAAAAGSAEPAPDSEPVIRSGRTVHRPSELIVPLMGGGEPLGALALGRADPVVRFNAADRRLAEQLGQRAGIAVLNARLFSERAAIATELQRGLLPPQLPDIPGLDMASLYRPAGELNEVGGDFYDAFPTPNGWMVVIGDVAGHGARAAALTGLARFTLRSVGQLTGDPLRAAEQLNRTLRDQAELSLCTAVCLLLRADGHRLAATTVSLGHPLPALLRGGTATGLGRPGTLAGAFDDGTWTAETVALRAGDAIVLYTDGVFDTVGRDGRLGEERLLARLGASPAGAAAVVADVDALLRDFQSGPQADDTALVVVTVTDAAAVVAEAA